MFFVLEPENAERLGDQSVVDVSTHLPQVFELHFILDGWLGNDILESFPCYVITERLRNALESSGVSGCEFATANIMTSTLFEELYPGRIVPVFHWLKVTGQAGVDDFGRAIDDRLVVSDRALKIMRSVGQLNHCEITEWET